MAGFDKKFLVVDDDPVSRMILQRILSEQGYQVIAAKDGTEGWELFQKEAEEISLAILDWMMPGMDGIELCRRIRGTETPHYVFIIFLSSKGEKKDVVEGLDAGADDYLIKPFDRDELLSRIRVGLRIVGLEQALRKANERLQVLATTDGLTGVLNRRTLLERLGEELERAWRERKPLSLLMLDIDRFKRINDTYGHPAGDRVLVEMAERLKSHLRPYDLVGRYGGEEFVVVISGADAEEGVAIAERIREMISSDPFPLDHGPLKVTVSIGVASFQPGDYNGVGQLAETLLKRADAALYRAKEGGRDRVVLFEGGKDEGADS